MICFLIYNSNHRTNSRTLRTYIAVCERAINNRALVARDYVDGGRVIIIIYRTSSALDARINVNYNDGNNGGR